MPFIQKKSTLLFFFLSLILINFMAQGQEVTLLSQLLQASKFITDPKIESEKKIQFLEKLELQLKESKNPPLLPASLKYVFADILKSQDQNELPYKYIVLKILFQQKKELISKNEFELLRMNLNHNIGDKEKNLILDFLTQNKLLAKISPLELLKNEKSHDIAQRLALICFQEINCEKNKMKQTWNKLEEGQGKDILGACLIKQGEEEALKYFLQKVSGQYLNNIYYLSLSLKSSLAQDLALKYFSSIDTHSSIKNILAISLSPYAQNQVLQQKLMNLLQKKSTPPTDKLLIFYMNNRLSQSPLALTFLTKYLPENLQKNNSTLNKWINNSAPFFSPLLLQDLEFFLNNSDIGKQDKKSSSFFIKNLSFTLNKLKNALEKSSPPEEKTKQVFFYKKMMRLLKQSLPLKDEFKNELKLACLDLLLFPRPLNYSISGDGFFSAPKYLWSKEDVEFWALKSYFLLEL